MEPMTLDLIPQLIWPAGAPDAAGDEDLDRPDLTSFPAPDPNGAGVLILPGGGYGGLATGHEGQDIGAWLNARGYHAWMLRYRLGPRYRHPAPLQDAIRAVELIREGGFDGKLGVWGFSAGGHLAATLSTAPEVTGQLACSVLAYPVISLEDEHTHAGSRNNLLGLAPDPALVQALSANLRVTATTPPAFLFHTGDDGAVRVENSILYYQALRAAGVPADLHIYAHGPHGVGLAANDPILGGWPTVLQGWLGEYLSKA